MRCLAYDRRWQQETERALCRGFAHRDLSAGPAAKREKWDVEEAKRSRVRVGDDVLSRGRPLPRTLDEMLNALHRPRFVFAGVT